MAFYFEGEPGDTREITYADLTAEVKRAANALIELGVKSGDRVAIYLPMIPEAVVAMLACARIGAPHTVIFGGFSADALPTRIQDCGVEVVITAESAEWLADFTRQLVEDRLVACGHNIAPIRAIYRWEGKVYDETQARVGLHTRASLVPTIVARADRDHADDVPCVIAMPIATGHPSYLRWIYEETSTA